MRLHKSSAAIMALLMVLLLSSTTAAAELKDISSSWAKADIQALAAEGVISGYPDGTFRPKNPITRAEFARIVARAFNLQSTNQAQFSDTRNHWTKGEISALAAKGIIQGYPDGRFHPDEKITRAEIVTMLIRALKLDKDFSAEQYDWWPTYTDMSEAHWSYNSVEIASRLGIVPSVFGSTFQPDRPATREETAAMVKAAADLITVQGTLSAVEDGAAITVEPLIGQSLVLEMAPDASVLRNGTKSEAGNLVEGDQVYLVANRAGAAQFIKANGIVTQSDVMSKITDLSKGLVTKEQLGALIKGDWQTLRGEMRYTLYDQLLKNGVKPHEAEAIITQDWSALSDFGKERLAEALASQWDLSPELIVALLDRDWSTAQEYAQVELTQRLLGGLLSESF
ncbi:MAG TPA: S-layer homology domain-containing protein [Firmicutes bacterium]|nr:S-layer homology domain-containing protein [Bacillota bacterium]